MTPIAYYATTYIFINTKWVCYSYFSVFFDEENQVQTLIFFIPLGM